MKQGLNILSDSKTADYLGYQWYKTAFKMHKNEIRELSNKVDSLSDEKSRSESEERLENALSRTGSQEKAG